MPILYTLAQAAELWCSRRPTTGPCLAGLAREARERLTEGDVELPAVDLGRHDALWEVPA